MRRLVAALFVVLAIAVVAGCGGGGAGSDGSGSGGALTKAAFIKAADKICSTADSEMAKELTRYAEEHGISTEGEPSEGQKLKLSEEVVLPNLKGQVEKLEELTPPAGDEGKIEDLTSTFSEAVAEAEADPRVAVDGAFLDEASRKAQAYGLKRCG